MTAIVLPEVKQVPTDAMSSRHGARVRLVVVHRWGASDHLVSLPQEARSYGGVINEFKNPANQASSHFVYPGSAVKDGGEVTQMVPYAMKAWTESFYNPVSVEIESADDIWVGNDMHGMHVLARMVAFLLHRYNLPAHWCQAAEAANNGRGFCRHADLGSAGGGHTQCPTTDMSLWHLFIAMVQHEAERGGFRPAWGS